MTMLMQCPTCAHTISLLPRLRNDGTYGAEGRCSTCHAVYAAEVREVTATDLTPEQVGARRNRTSHNGTVHGTPA